MDLANASGMKKQQSMFFLRILVTGTLITAPLFYSANVLASPFPRMADVCSPDGNVDTELARTILEQTLQELIGTIQELRGAHPQGGGDEEIMCKVTDELQSELMCEVGDLGEDFTTSDVDTIVSCVQDGSFRKHTNHWALHVKLSIKFGDYFEFTFIDITYDPSTETVDTTYTCDNLQNGDTYTGGLSEIKEDIKAFQRQMGQKDE